MQGVSRSQDPELGPAVSKYPPSSGYGDAHARNHTYGHMHRDQQFSAPEAVDGLYPSGFPRQSVTPRKTSRTADRMLWRFKQDPDVELKPVVPGTMTDAEARTRAVQGPLFKPKTPEYEYELKSRHRKAENQALSKIQHRREDMADIPKYDEAGQQWEHARAKISQAEQEARHVEYKMREAADLARRSNEARSEAEQAMQLEQETRATAKDLPGRTRAYLYDTRMALSDAKGDVDDRVRDLAAAERELEKADFDLRYKTHEAKIVNKAAVAKRTEVGEVERLVAKLANLRRDADQAEERAVQVSEEAKELAQALEERRANLDSRAQNLVMSRNKVDKLAQEYAAATAEAEMAEAKSVRQGEEAEAFRRIADEKRLLAYQLADKWTEAKKEAEVAKEREVALWQEALKTGEQVHPLTEETLNKHMQGPIIIEDERNAESGQGQGQGFEQNQGFQGQGQNQGQPQEQGFGGGQQGQTTMV
ncbi:hypothetical protein ABBQ32_013329 [Trebouxia sp. C0010 RCD-2024]